MDRILPFELSNLEAKVRTCCIYIGGSRIAGQDFDEANYKRGRLPMLVGKVLVLSQE